jgi:hypothetical protein
MNNYSILMYFSVCHNRPYFLLHIICVVSKPHVGDTGPPLVSGLTKRGERTVHALPLCAPSSDVDMRPKNRNNLVFTESRKWFQHKAMGTKYVHCQLYSYFNNTSLHIWLTVGFKVPSIFKLIKKFKIRRTPWFVSSLESNEQRAVL